ncbi:hypothetical protein O0L34_g16955 [Tuta absoluta]|nr:hypothetical protein O0L34_g16955 [Tuta absoluta]
MDGKIPPDDTGGGPSIFYPCSDVEFEDANLKRASFKRHLENINNHINKRATNMPAAASAQHSYLVPEFQESSKLKYSDADLSPFIVHVSKEETDQAAGSPLRILKFAQFLHKNAIQGITKDGIKSFWCNRVVVEFTNAN